MFPGVNIFKCLGHEYLIENKNFDTLYIVIPEYSIKGTLKLGDVLVGNYSNGFLETVVELTREEGSAFVHTELTRCRENGSYGGRYLCHELFESIICLYIYFTS